MFHQAGEHSAESSAAVYLLGGRNDSLCLAVPEIGPAERCLQLCLSITLRQAKRFEGIAKAMTSQTFVLAP